MMNPFEALRGFLKRREQSAQHHAKKNTRLFVESLETRRLLTVNNALPSVNGTTFSDANNNGIVDTGEAIANVQLQLWQDDGDGNFNSTLDTQVGAVITSDANGEYCFDNLDPNQEFFVEQIAQTVSGMNLPQLVSNLVTSTPQLIIDTFITSQSTIAVPPPVSNDESSLTLTASEAIGGERDLAVELQAGTSEVQLRVNPFGLDDVLLFDSSAGTVGTREVTWDGTDGDGDSLAMGLGGLDLTQDGTLSGFTMRIGVDANGANARLRLYQGNGANFSEAIVPIPVTGGAATQFVFVPFSSFVGPSLEGNVDAIQLFIDTGNRSVDGQIDTIGVLGPQIENFANEVQVDVELIKTVDATEVSNGDTITWMLNLTNNLANANAPATGLTVTDVLPAGVTLVNSNATDGAFADGTWTLPDPLDPGETETLTIVTTVNNDVAGGTVLTNTAQVSTHNEADVDSTPGNDDGDQSEDDEDNAAVTIRDVIDLEVTKESNTTIAQVGDQVTFTITVSNNDENANADATGVQVTDTLPAGMTLVSATPSGNGTFNNGVWTLVDPLSPGGTRTLQVVASVDSGVSGGSQLKNVAEVTSANEPDVDSLPNNDDGDQSEDDEANAMFGIGSIIDLELTKSADVATAQAGDTIVWTVNVTNNQDNANASATNVVVTDLVPAGVTFVNAVASGNGTFANGTWTLVDPLLPGSSASLTLTTTVNAGAGGAQLVNSAQVSSVDQTDIDSIPNNDDGDRSEDDEDEAIVILDSQIDLQLQKAVSQSTVFEGDDVVWTIMVTNNPTNANAPATGVTVTDVLPEGVTLASSTATNGSLNGDVWTLANPLAPGGTATLMLTTTVDPGASGTIINVAEVATANEADIDSTPGNDDGDQSEDDEDNAQIEVTPLGIDLELNKNVDVTAALPGDQVTWTVALSNNQANANTSATGVQVTDLIPSGLSLVSATPTNGTFNVDTWTLGSPLAPGATATLTLVTTVLDNPPDTIENVAQVSAANETDVDSTPANDDGDQSEDDEDSASIAITPQVIDLELTKSVDANAVLHGDQVTWTVSITNNETNANSSATGVQVSDIIPNGLTLQSSSATDGTFAANMWTLNSPLAPGDTETLTLVTTVDNNAPATINNVAQVSAANETDVDSSPGNDDGDQSEDDEDIASITVTPTAIDLELTKDVSSNTAIEGDQVTWTITLLNNPASANTSATGVQVSDVIPSGLTVQSSTATNGTFSGNLWTLASPLAPGDSETLTLVTTVNVGAPSSIRNVAQVSAANETDVDSQPANDDGDQSQDDEDSAQLTITPVAIDLELSKSVSATNVRVGDQVTWTITVTNNQANANTAATGVQVSDVLPTGVTLESSSPSDGAFSNNVWTLNDPLDPGESETLNIVTRINNSASGGDVLANVAQVSAANQSDIDSTPGNDDGDQSEDDEATAQVTLDALTDLEIEKTASQTNVTEGDQLTWVITVTNDPLTANTAATGVIVSDTLPGGVTFVSSNANNGSYNNGTGIWTLASPLQPGDTATLTIVATVNPGATNATLMNVAQITSQDQQDVDSTPANDDGDQSEDDEVKSQVNATQPRPALSKRALLASA